MAGTRKEWRQQIGGYVAASLKKAIADLRQEGLTETAVIEVYLIQGLLQRKKLTIEQVEKLVEQARVSPAAVVELKRLGVLK